MLMNRVEAKYGRKARRKLARILFESMPTVSKKEFHSWFKYIYGSKASKNPEEYCAAMLDWHNDPEMRMANYDYQESTSSIGMLQKFIKHNAAMKAGLKIMRKFALTVSVQDLTD